MKFHPSLKSCPICKKKWEYTSGGKKYSLIICQYSMLKERPIEYHCPYCNTKWDAQTRERIIKMKCQTCKFRQPADYLKETYVCQIATKEWKKLEIDECKFYEKRERNERDIRGK